MSKIPMTWKLTFLQLFDQLLGQIAVKVSNPIFSSGPHKIRSL